MSKKILLLLSLALGLAWPACTTLTIPTDYLTVDAFRRANQAANWTATREAHNDCKDSLNETRTRIVNWTSNLALKSLQDLAFKMDDDNNGTHKIAFLNGAADTLGKVTEDTTWRFYRHGIFDSNLTVGGKLVVTDSLRLTLQTASRPVWTSANKQLTTANAPTGTGSTLVLSASPTGTGTWLLPNITMSGDMLTSRSFAGGVVFNFLDNTSNTANSSSVYNSRVAGASAGDPLYQATVDGVRAYSWGIDNSASDAFVLAEGGALGLAGDIFSALPSGAMTVHRALVASSTLAVTGAATFTAPPVFSSVTASEFLLVDGSKGLTSVAGTGTGSVARAGSPAFTGTVGAAAITATGVVTADTIISAKFYTEGTFTITSTGFTASNTATAKYTRIGKHVTLYIPGMPSTSNATGCTMTGIPAVIRPPVGSDGNMGDAVIFDNSTLYPGWLYMNSDGTVSIYFWSAHSTSTSTFTNSGTKGLGEGTYFQYNVQ